MYVVIGFSERRTCKGILHYPTPHIIFRRVSHMLVNVMWPFEARDGDSCTCLYVTVHICVHHSPYQNFNSYQLHSISICNFSSCLSICIFDFFFFVEYERSKSALPLVQDVSDRRLRMPSCKFRSAIGSFGLRQADWRISFICTAESALYCYNGFAFGQANYTPSFLLHLRHLTNGSDRGYCISKLIVLARGICLKSVCMPVQDFVDTLQQIPSLCLSTDKAYHVSKQGPQFSITLQSMPMLFRYEYVRAFTMKCFHAKRCQKLLCFPLSSKHGRTPECQHTLAAKSAFAVATFK